MPCPVLRWRERVEIRHHCPTQAYESLFHLVMAGVLALCLWRDAFRSHRLKLYLIAYGVFRFLTEFIRPEPAWWLGLTFYQWASLALAAGLAVQWRVDRRGQPLTAGERSPENPEGLVAAGPAK